MAILRERMSDGVQGRPWRDPRRRWPDLPELELSRVARTHYGAVDRRALAAREPIGRRSSAMRWLNLRGLSAFLEPLLRAVQRPEDASGQVRAQSRPLFWWAGDMQAPADRVDPVDQPAKARALPG